MPEVSCYDMALYCDNEDCKAPDADLYRLSRPTEFQGHTRGQCVTQARKYGWKFHRNGTVSCGYCNKRQLQPPPATSPDSSDEASAKSEALPKGEGLPDEKSGGSESDKEKV